MLLLLSLAEQEFYICHLLGDTKYSRYNILHKATRAQIHTHTNNPCVNNTFLLQQANRVPCAVPKGKEKYAHVCTHATSSWESLPLLAYNVSHLRHLLSHSPHGPCSWPLTGFRWKDSCYLHSKQLSGRVFVSPIKQTKNMPVCFLPHHL